MTVYRILLGVFLAICSLDLVGVVAAPEPAPRGFTAGVLLAVMVAAVVIHVLLGLYRREVARSAHLRNLAVIRNKRRYPVRSPSRRSSAA